MKRYYMIYDTTKEYKSKDHAQYFEKETNNNILTDIIEFAKKNKTNIEDLRVFSFETKKQYEESFRKYATQVEWL